MSNELVDWASGELQKRLQVFKGQQMTQATFYRVQQVIKDHYDECQRKGIPFPRCVPVVLPPPYVWIHVVRAELTHEEIQALARQIIDAVPSVTGRALAWSIRKAFPDYKPDLCVSPSRIVTMSGSEILKPTTH